MDALDFEVLPPNASAVGLRWHEMLGVARDIIEQLPPDEVGKCVVNSDRHLFNGSFDELDRALREQTISFHEGQIGGSWPTIKPPCSPH